ncbi:MAG: hypothetical protein R2828_16580 [Saprospiraceae bacterium]
MKVQRMIHKDVIGKVNTYTLDDKLIHLDIPLVITFLALPDNYTADGIEQEDGETYLTIRLPYEQIKNCAGSALPLMTFALLSQIRHLKHMDWYNVYWQVKNALRA